MSVIGTGKPHLIPKECHIKLSELERISERSMTKSILLQIMLNSQTGPEYKDECFLLKQEFFEKAGREDSFLWMQLESFQENASKELVSLLQKGMFTLAACAEVAYHIWSSPSSIKRFRRESLVLLFETQAFVERALDTLAFEGDYDQILAKWWSWSNCESVGLTSLQLRETALPDNCQIETLSASLFHLRGTAGLVDETKDFEIDPDTDLDCPVS